MKHERRLNTHGFRLPEIFKFILSQIIIEACNGIGEGTIFTATLNNNNQYIVTWNEDGVNGGTTYHIQEAYNAINNGDWLLTH